MTRGLFGDVGREAKNFAVSADPREVRRGGELRVLLRIDGRASDRIEVGLVCTEFWDDRRSDGQGNTHRATTQTEVHKEWVPADPSSPQQWFTFTVPPGAPPSYEGAALSIAWRVSAREPQTMRRDPRSDCAIWVLP